MIHCCQEGKVRGQAEIRACTALKEEPEHSSVARARGLSNEKATKDDVGKTTSNYATLWLGLLVLLKRHDEKEKRASICDFIVLYFYE